MMRLNINRKRSGVPVLSRKQIDDIGERLVQDFCPDAMIHPQALDVDLFAQDYLGMEQDYQYLSHCGVYLGMTVFNDTNRVVVFNPEKQEAEYISARAKTIIIDNTLLEEKQEHRYRFTMGHEAAGHGVLHEAYFGYDRNQLTLFDTVNEAAMIQCRTVRRPASAGLTVPTARGMRNSRSLRSPAMWRNPQHAAKASPWTMSFTIPT